MNTNLFRSSLIALFLAAGSAASLADDGKQPQPKPADALKGPSVPDRHVPGVENGLGTMEGGFDKKGVAREMPIPHREFMQILLESVGDKAPEAVRVNAEQHEQIEKINREFTEKQRSYIETNKGEIDKLAEKYGPEVHQLAQRLAFGRGAGMPERGAAKKPGNEAKRGEKPAGDAPADGMQAEPGSGLSDEARAEVIAKLKELKANAPKAEDARTAIWGVLKPDQQAAVQKRVDAFKAEREKQMDEKYKEREKKKFEERGTKKNPATPGAAAPAEKGKPGEGEVKHLDAAQRTELINQLPADLKERVSKMPEQLQDRILGRLSEIKPDQREEFYNRMRERIKNGGEGTPKTPKK